MIREIWCLVPPERGQGELLSLQKKLSLIDPLSIVFEPFILLGSSSLPEKVLRNSFDLLGSMIILEDVYFIKQNLCLSYSLEGLNSFLDLFKEDILIGQKGSFILAINFYKESEPLKMVEDFFLEKPISFHTFSLQKWTINFKSEEWVEWQRKNIFYKKKLWKQ